MVISCLCVTVGTLETEITIRKYLILIAKKKDELNIQHFN